MLNIKCVNNTRKINRKVPKCKEQKKSKSILLTQEEGKMTTVDCSHWATSMLLSFFVFFWVFIFLFKFKCVKSINCQHPHFAQPLFRIGFIWDGLYPVKVSSLNLPLICFWILKMNVIFCYYWLVYKAIQTLCPSLTNYIYKQIIIINFSLQTFCL
jgi:hypothetical protein